VTLQRPYHSDPEYYEGRAEGLLASARDGTEDAVAAFARHDAPLTLDGARSVLAQEHGLADWAALNDHLIRPDDDPFVRAYRAVEGHDLDALKVVLDEHPDVVAAVGTNGNDLLGMAGGTCDERTVALLLERGADVTHANVHGWTPLHQAAYGDLPLIARMVLDAGAKVDADARGTGGTPLVVALFWGNRTTAELLAEHGVHPRNLRAAAGLGRLDLVAEVLADGSAGARRGFYRPHGGFPAWTPSDDPQEVLDEALSWAARSDRADALSALVAEGADVAADVYRGTALSWAAACGRVASVRRLVELGADVNQRTTFGGPAHGEKTTALHLAAQAGRLDAIRALLDLGADPRATDDLYQSTPADWAEHGGSREAAELLREH
jgi:ankyrin repeat protein